MAVIELVIKIKEEDFEIIKHNNTVNNPLCPLRQEEIVSKIANGVPLPKIHGRLVDADEVHGEWVCTYDGGYECIRHLSCDDCSHSEYQCYTDIRDLPTIIEPYIAEEDRV